MEALPIRAMPLRARLCQLDPAIAAERELQMFLLHLVRTICLSHPKRTRKFWRGLKSLGLPVNAHFARHTSAEQSLNYFGTLGQTSRGTSFEIDGVVFQGQ